MIDYSELDSHEHKMVEKSGNSDEFECETCGLTTTVQKGVKKARQERKW